MPAAGTFQPSRRNVRLDTLVRLRWLAVVGQTTAVLVVAFGLEFTFPLWAWLAVIALMIAAMVVIGGATRLTHSGLSITQWKPIMGVTGDACHGD